MHFPLEAWAKQDFGTEGAASHRLDHLPGSRGREQQPGARLLGPSHYYKEIW